MAKWWLLLLAMAPALQAQKQLDRLAAESARLRALPPTDQVDRRTWTNFKLVLRDWIESGLPPNLASLDANFADLEAQLNAGLRQAGILDPHPDVPSEGPGHVSPIKLSRPAQHPGALLVEARITVPCGHDGSVYVYYFSASGRLRVLEGDGRRDWGDELADAQFSPADAAGNHLFYAAWYGVQCMSVWNQLDYRVFRTPPDSASATVILSELHSSADYEIPCQTDARRIANGIPRRSILPRLSPHLCLPLSHR